MGAASDRGLTLIEMLVVLAIIGVASAAVVLGVGAAGRRPGGEIEANRLAERTRMAMDEALVTGQPAALAWDETGYGFRRWDAASGGWREAAASGEDQRRPLPHGLKIASEAPKVIALGNGRAFALRLGEGERAWSVASDGLNVWVEAP